MQQHKLVQSEADCKPKQDKIVTTLRQSLKITEDKKSILVYCEERINQLLKDVTSMIGGKRKQQSSDLAFPYTGICKKKE